jgi:hypothetical protein
MAMMTTLNQPRFTAAEMAELERRARQHSEMRERRSEHEDRARRHVRLRRPVRTPQLAPTT